MSFYFYTSTSVVAIIRTRSNEGISSPAVQIYNNHTDKRIDGLYDTDDESGDEDNSDDEIQDNDHDGDDDYHIPSSTMSLSLMRALGIDTEGVVEEATDWRPPSQSGLQHSARKNDCIPLQHKVLYREVYNIIDHNLIIFLIMMITLHIHSNYTNRIERIRCS